MRLKKLTLSACNNKGIVINEIEPFEVMLNPESFSIKSSICYTEDNSNGCSTSGAPQYRYQPVKQLVLEPFILDVTGAIPKTLSLMYGSMNDIIDHLEEVVYNINEDTGAPPVILVEWGTFTFRAQLCSMNIKYTLFDSDGDPLRAEISLDLQEFPDSEIAPHFGLATGLDETRYIEVKDGDTLPAMCERMYQDSSYYDQIAELNELDDYQNLEPGTYLYFPPLAD